MSVKLGSQFIAGNLALRVQDRLFTAKRTLENSQEYYDIANKIAEAIKNI